MGFSYTAQAVEVSVDLDLGQVTVEKVWAAIDCGFAINPMSVEGQVQGASWMGMGQAISEETVYENGRHLVANLLDYRVPTIVESPDIEVHIVESMDPNGPFGAKEASEGPLSGILSAVAAAVEEACKILMVYWMVWRRPEFDERMDGIVYAARAGLGFALVENVMYLFGQDTIGGQLELWMMRAFLAVPGHAIWTGMIGALAARKRFDGRGLGLIGGYLLAVAFHGAYDCTVFMQAPLKFEGHFTASKLMILGPIVLTIIGFFVLRGMAKVALTLDDADAARAAAAHAHAQAQLVAQMPPMPGPAPLG